MHRLLLLLLTLPILAQAEPAGEPAPPDAERDASQTAAEQAPQPAERQAVGVPLNRASSDQLAGIEGVDDETAAAVVALRAERGRLNSVEELRILPGMDDDTLDALRRNTSVDLPLRSRTGEEFETVEDVMSAFDHEPTVQEVQALAMRYTHTNRDQVVRWLKASRRSAWLPQLTARYQYYDRFGQDFDYLTDEAGDPYPELTDGDVQDEWRGYVEVRWRLDDLVMSSEQIRVISEAQDVVKLRDKVLSEVTRLYFDRRRLQVELLLSSGDDLRQQVEDELRLMEFTAELDAFTGGGFSAALADSGAAE